MARILIIWLAWAGTAFAEDWKPLSGDEIGAALTDKTFVYEDAEQKFFASGRTLYTTVEDSWGYWRVDGDQYCSQWPPGEAWDCYRVEASGDQLRWTDDFGNASTGELKE